MPGDRRGFILPLVLLATLAITALAVAAFTLAQAEHRATEWERTWVGAVAGADGRVGAPVAGPLAALGSGYRLVAVGDAGTSPLLRHEVWWCLDPRAEAAGTWTAGDHPPRLGPLGPARILDLLGVHAETEEGTEVLVGGAGSTPGDSVRIVAVDRGRLAVVAVGEAGGVLVVAEGSLRLAGSGTFRGALLVGGQLERPEAVEVLGGARAGTLVASPDSEGVGGLGMDLGYALRTAALEVLPQCPEMVHAMGRLGYF
ncbi:hypothetical protein BH23GEM11_BH23GEM11_16340 [soil metagenome]